MRDFLQDRIRLVDDLIKSDIVISYADVSLILCSVLSACAAQRWPGEKIDQRRFVELLVQHSPDEFHTSWVCVPALINKSLVSEEETPYGPPGQSTRIFRGEEIDVPLSDAATRYPGLGHQDLKRCTYAVLIYEWLRCGYAHEYCPHENITQVQASCRNARVSYIGRGIRGGGIRRMISFHLDYLIRLTKYHADNVPDQPTPRPLTWWFDT